MGEISQYSIKYQQLLRDLKDTIEGLLITQVANVWSIYGGLNRLHNVVEKIFKHGCKMSENECSFYKFVQGLEWLQPESTKSYFSIDCEYQSHIPSHLKESKPSIWLYRSLENHSLSQKLSWLLSDKTHLHACYQTYAFLCQEKYAEATLICLRAVERNQPSLMSEINPYLFLEKKHSIKVHRRCSSFPDNHLKKIYEEKTCRRSLTVQNICDINDEEIKYCGRWNIQGKLKPWKSMPILQTTSFKLGKADDHCQSKTLPNTPVHDKKTERLLCTPLEEVHYSSCKTRNLKKAKTRVQEVKHVINNWDIVEHTPPLSSSQDSGNVAHDDLITSTKSLPGRKSHTSNLSTSPLSYMESFLPKAGEKDYRKLPKKSFIEDGGMSVLPMSTGYFPKPAKGQSLLSFLSSGQFARANAELDRENAHFSISEAIISAIEQIRCKTSSKTIDEPMDDSDPEILDLKQRIRLRRTAKAMEKQRKAWATAMMVDTKTNITASPLSTSPASTSMTGSYMPSSSASDASGSSDSDVAELQIEQSASDIPPGGLSASLASLYSDSDLARPPTYRRRRALKPPPTAKRGAPDGAVDVGLPQPIDVSAEGVAISLIRKFSDQQLPKASDLEWLVSEEDAPQALLPLPESWPVSPDSCEENTTPLRGTEEWAPPRPQIIFTLHPPPRRKQLMAKQNYRCAGCSMKVSVKYASRFRYCEYLGRYFCTGCHSNQLALIPGRVLQKWDFNRYPVSTFSYRLLEQMYTDPLFRVFELNKSIGKLSKNLQFCSRYRQGLYYLKDFIFSCKYAETIKETLQQDIPNILSDPEVYSIEDLVHIKDGEMKKKLVKLVDVCCQHTAECKLCLARGFICEVCNSDEVIFPWQMRTVTRCVQCGSCYHSTCWNLSKTQCKKCLRLQMRKETTISQTTSSRT